MIYELLLPEPKVIKASARFRHQSESNRQQPWEFQTGNNLRSLQPELSHMCAESRFFLLERGTYIFAKDNTEGGLWWNPKHDVLVFEGEWWADREAPSALEGLQGLEHVHHVGLDATTAKHLGYQVHYASGPGVKSLVDLPATQSERKVNGINLAFYSIGDVRGEFFLPKLFPAIQSVTVAFPSPSGGRTRHNDRMYGHNPYYLGSGRDSVRFDLGTTQIETVRHQLGRYKELWQRTQRSKTFQEWIDGLPDFRTGHGVPGLSPGSVLPYYKNIEHAGVGSRMEPMTVNLNWIDLAFDYIEPAEGSFDKEHSADTWDLLASDEDASTDEDSASEEVAAPGLMTPLLDLDEDPAPEQGAASEDLSASCRPSSP